ncbi:MAG: hypothetical protein IPN81_09135 [Nitrosomonadales bacterium]|nr:hypothetical protein [Nitrosomonadales bacterium]
METARITHFRPERWYEKLRNLEAYVVEFIRNNNEILWYLGDQKAVQVKRQYSGKSFPALLPEQLSALNENYFIHTGEQARIAGFDTQAIIFQLKILCAMPIKCGRIGFRPVVKSCRAGRT